ncbi:MAG: hypothetical protein C0392_04665 [Syntrophus sp. (in: bacteria)]|nr:hypothetical protein [Syntrophus sp. (in: bacteria)]
MKKSIGLLVCLLLAIAAVVPPSSAWSAPTNVVGRVYHIEGDLLRYVPSAQDWVAVVQDAPFGTEDTLFTGNQGMTELVAPNGAWARIGNNTQIQFIALNTDVTEMDVASGVARIYNKGSKKVIKVTSPIGYVLAFPDTVFDFYVGENSVEVIAVKGTVSFVHSATNAKYDAAAGSSSILADQNQVSSGSGAVDPNWEQWNGVREGFWAEKSRIRGWSREYLPPSLHGEAYALEENGRWEAVNYEGSQRHFWRPTTVSADWAPFTAGRWTDWFGDQTWIPSEPFGYVTHHYGNWVLVGNTWYWAPPVVKVRRGHPAPLLDIDFYWTPGRVSWIHSGAYVGWVPLAPRETYYSHRQWGGSHDVVITNVNASRVHVNVRNYAYANRAVIVNQNNFYTVNNYKTVQVTNINKTTIINNYKAAPVINNTVINNYTTNNQKHNFTNAKVHEKPHNTVITRIHQNDKVIHGPKPVNAASIEQQVKKIPEGKINRTAKIDTPKITNPIVPANQINRPKSEVKLPQKEIKGKPGQPGVTPPGKPGQPGQTGVVPPGKPGQPGQTGVVPPGKPGQPGQPGVTPPGKPGQPQQPGVVVQPPRPGQPQQPGVVQPPRPGQPGQPGVTPPGKPGQPGQPGVTPPGKPGQPQQPGVVQPPRPGQPQPTAQPPRPTPQPQPTAQPPRPTPQPQPTAQPPRPTPQPQPKPVQVAPPKPAPAPPPKPVQVAPPKPAPAPPPKPAPAPAKPAAKPPEKPGQPPAKP